MSKQGCCVALFTNRLLLFFCMFVSSLYLACPFMCRVAVTCTLYVDTVKYKRLYVDHAWEWRQAWYDGTSCRTPDLRFRRNYKRTAATVQRPPNVVNGWSLLLVHAVRSRQLWRKLGKQTEAWAYTRTKLVLR